jgi:peptide/nickel transport system substrate-binding protein
MQDIFYQEVKKSPGLKVFTPLSPAIYTIFMPQWDPKSPRSDVRVRKAASLAIDRKMLADINHPGCDPAGTIGQPGDPWVVNFPAHPYDPEQAKKLLAEAGYPKGFHGGKLYPFGGNWQWGEQTANYWKAIGINVDVVLLERPAWIAAHDSGKFKGDTFIEGVLAPTIGARLAYLFGPTSYGNYADIQALWEQYNREMVPKVRKDIVVRIQNLIYDRNMYLPLTFVNNPNAHGPRAKGNPYRIPMIWYPTPFEDIEISE